MTTELAPNSILVGKTDDGFPTVTVRHGATESLVTTHIYELTHDGAWHRSLGRPYEKILRISDTFRYWSDRERYDAIVAIAQMMQEPLPKKLRTYTSPNGTQYRYQEGASHFEWRTSGLLTWRESALSTKEMLRNHLSSPSIVHGLSGLILNPYEN